MVTAAPGYPALATKYLSELTGRQFILGGDLVEATSDTGAYVLLSSVLKRTSTKLTKICNDIRLLSSGPRCGLNEINLPQMQPGSSIMPGKVNPVLCESLMQVAARVAAGSSVHAAAAHFSAVVSPNILSHDDREGLGRKRKRYVAQYLRQMRLVGKRDIFEFHIAHDSCSRLESIHFRFFLRFTEKIEYPFRCCGRCLKNIRNIRGLADRLGGDDGHRRSRQDIKREGLARRTIGVGGDDRERIGGRGICPQRRRAAEHARRR